MSVHHSITESINDYSLFTPAIVIFTMVIIAVILIVTVITLISVVFVLIVVVLILVVVIVVIAVALPQYKCIFQALPPKHYSACFVG